MHTKNEIGDSLTKQMPYCTNHKCINYYEDSCMYLFEDGPLKINPMEYSDETCEAFISGKNPLYLEEILESLVQQHVDETEELIEAALRKEFKFGDKRITKLRETAQAMYDSKSEVNTND